MMEDKYVVALIAVIAIAVGAVAWAIAFTQTRWYETQRAMSPEQICAMGAISRSNDSGQAVYCYEMTRRKKPAEAGKE